MTNRQSGFSKCTSFYLLICLILMHPIAFNIKTSSSELNLVSGLSSLDKKYMEAQKSLIDELVRSMGQSLNGDADHDIELLQRLLDSRKIKNNMTPELQAMGFVLGDLLANELDMHWVIYKDHVGRSRALRYKSSNNFLFPVTMISRRREVNNLTSVAKIYEKAFNSISPLRDPLPFQ